MDRRIQGLATKLGWRFTRYADDLTFSLPGEVSSDAKIGALMGGVKHIVEEEGFHIHEKEDTSSPTRFSAENHWLCRE